MGEADGKAAVVHGVGRDAPTVVSSGGGKQSYLPYRADLLPAKATLAVAEVLRSGACKYGEDNWRPLGVKDHINHAMVHILAYLAGDRQDDHLEHAACRMLMAVEVKCS